MYEIYEKVRIIKKDIVGTIVDINKKKGSYIYIVESDKKGYVDDKDAYPSLWPLYDCKEEEIEAFGKNEK